jgi:hypothetical protein
LSYDLYLVQAPPAASDAEIAHLALVAAETDLPSAPLDGSSRRNRDVLVDAVRAANPSLEPFAFDFAAIAKSEGITADEARERFQHVELNGPEDGNGIQITVFGKWATVTVPYWHHGPTADSVWSEIWRYLEVLSSVGDLRIYDPQLDRQLDLATDRAEVVRTYEHTVTATQRATADAATSPPKRRWWRLW